MTEHEAFEDVLITVRMLDRAERRRTGIPLTLDGTREWGSWVGEIDHYATRLETELAELGQAVARDARPARRVGCGDETRVGAGGGDGRRDGEGYVMPSSEHCADCGAENPDLVRVDAGGEVRTVCAHRYACEARQMLAAGEPVEKAAAHAQQPRPW